MVDLDLQATVKTKIGNNRRVTVSCPKCSEERGKSGTRTLCVWRDGGKIKYQCRHSDQCAWNKTQVIIDDKADTPEILNLEEPSFIPIPSDATLPISSTDIAYPYVNTDGDIMFYMIRTQDKKFYPLSYSDSGEFYTQAPKNKLFYKSDKIVSSDWVMIVEGEKAADKAQEILGSSIVVTTAPFGAGGLKAMDLSLFSGKNIILWPDNDEPGKLAIQELKVKLQPIVKSIKIANLDLIPNLPEKWDLADKYNDEYVTPEFIRRYSEPHKEPQRQMNSWSHEKILAGLKKIQTGLPLGWKNTDKNLRFPQSGLVTILGRTSHGKSALMLNLTVNMLKQCTKKIVYYSYEVPILRMYTKLVMILEGQSYHPIGYQNEETYRELINKGELESIELLKDYLSTRLELVDEPEDIKLISRQLDNDYYNDSVVFLDYLQLIPISSMGSRYEKLQIISNTLRAVANKRNMLIITGSQITEGETPYQDQAREARDIEQASELVLRIWNKTVAEARGAYKEERGEDKKKDKVAFYDDVDGDFVINVLKNRNGEVNMRYGFNLQNGAKLIPVEQVDTSTDF